MVQCSPCGTHLKFHATQLKQMTQTNNHILYITLMHIQIHKSPIRTFKCKKVYCSKKFDFSSSSSSKIGWLYGSGSGSPGQISTKFKYFIKPMSQSRRPAHFKGPRAIPTLMQGSANKGSQPKVGS